MRRVRGDRGQAGVQYIGLLPLLVIVVAVCIKIYIMINTVEQIDNAARTGARTASINHSPAQCPTAALDALPTWLKAPPESDDRLEDGSGQWARATVSGSGLDTISCRVEARVPVLWQGVPFDLTVNRTVHMPG